MVTFTCSAVGIPPPDITWRRCEDGEILQDNGNIIITDAVMAGDYVLPDSGGVVPRVNSSLTFMEILDEDSGTYACIANNTARNNEREFEVLVQG